MNYFKIQKSTETNNDYPYFCYQYLASISIFSYLNFSRNKTQRDLKSLFYSFFNPVGSYLPRVNQYHEVGVYPFHPHLSSFTTEVCTMNNKILIGIKLQELFCNIFIIMCLKFSHQLLNTDVVHSVFYCEGKKSMYIILIPSYCTYELLPIFYYYK